MVQHTRPDKLCQRKGNWSMMRKLLPKGRASGKISKIVGRTGFGLIAWLSAANIHGADVDLSFDSARSGGSVVWKVGGSETVSSTSSAGLSRWTMSFENLDLLGDGGAYDGTVTINVSHAGVSYSGSKTRYTFGAGDTLNFSKPSLVLANASGASNHIDAGELTVTFKHYTQSLEVSSGSCTLTAPGWPGSPAAVSSGVKNITGAQSQGYSNPNTTMYLFGTAGQFTVTVATPAPDGLGAVANASSGIDLSWGAAANADSYAVFRNVVNDSSTASMMASGLTGTSYTDTSYLNNGQVYYYWVKALYSYGYSDFSSSSSASASISVPAGVTRDSGSAMMAALPLTNYGVGHAAMLQTPLLTGSDGKATFRIAADVIPASGSEIVTAHYGWWGVDNPYFTGNEQVAAVGNLRVIEFKPNGGSLTQYNITNLRFGPIRLINGGDIKSRGFVTANGITEHWADLDLNIPQFTGHMPSAIDLGNFGTGAPVKRFSFGAENGSMFWQVRTISANYDEIVPEPAAPNPNGDGFVLQVKGGTHRPAPVPYTGEVDSEIKRKVPWFAQPTRAARIAAGQNGYAFITTKDIASRSTKLQDYIMHKRKQGLIVYVITEDDYDPEGKNPIGVNRALAIRKWMHENYKKLNLLYTMFVGNPHPKEGDIPMLNGRGYPSDWPYADCSSPNENLQNGVYTTAIIEAGLVDGYPDVWVGRTHVYGDDHEWASVRDLDILLQRTIDFENETDVDYRHNILFANVGNVGVKRFSNMRNALVDPMGARYRILMGDFGDRTPTVGKTGGQAVIDELNSHNYGVLQFHGHGNVESIIGTISTSQARKLAPEKPAGFGYAGACSIATPEKGENIVWALVRHATIGFIGATRTVGAGAGVPRPGNSHAYTTPLYHGYCNGEAFWLVESYAMQSNVEKIGGGGFKLNYFGDPSVVVMPKLTGRTLVVAPNAPVEICHEAGRSDAADYYDYYIKNNGTASADYTVSFDVDWLSASDSSFSLTAGESKTLRVSCGSMGSLPIGVNKGWMTVTSSNAGSVTRELRAVHYLPKVASYQDCENVKSYGKDQQAQLVPAVFGNGLEHIKGQKFPLESNVHFNNPCRKNGSVAFWLKLDAVPTDGILFNEKETWSITLENSKLNYTVFLNHFDGDGVEGKVKASVVVPTSLTAGQWHHFAISIDADNDHFIAWLDGTAVAQKDLPYAKLGIGDTTPPTFGEKGQSRWNPSVDEVWVAYKCFDQTDIDSLMMGGWARLTAPLSGSRIGENNTTLSWKTVPSATAYNVYFGSSAEAVVNATTASPEYIGQVTATHKAVVLTNQYNYWRVDAVTDNGTTKGFVWSFEYIDGYVAQLPVFGEVSIPDWKVGDNLPLYDLNTFIASADPEAELTFELLSGAAGEGEDDANWLVVTPDGSMGSNYGPNSSHLGTNSFEVKVSDQWGASDTITFTINVISE